MKLRTYTDEDVFYISPCRSPVATGVAKGGGTRGPCPPPPCWSASKKKGKGVGNWSMPLHKLPLIMAINVQKRTCRYDTQIFKNLPIVGGGTPPPPPTPSRRWSLRSPALAPRGLILKFKRGSRGLIYATSHNLPPPPIVMAFMCKKMLFSYTNYHHTQKKISYRGRGNPPPTPSPRSVASLPRFGHPLTNPGCITGIAKGHKAPFPPPPPPLIGIKEIH